ncbi:dihydrolipoamide acetyltransferase family protein [Planomonospora parontospora]|uniref:dihydrolipoamide acetyltransferase family protein n=1 Tax=Planomonospora parontospora TaxID=58119 RepID=UPI001670CAAF|nr:dihydrolipoamide acetyltransferase family protein [Planomonospora parontospora]GGL48545.1 dihydrolipoamide acetyltransferase component of pyruvate dehydrogenase complex [Planomonospora parontospora subsp. antibiotica]GII18887.1 dihydrolipoamide acetyltransferase component of pyruvate dehydrogenase complex [Planomonospora parontospora subsp. antibiotica]
MKEFKLPDVGEGLTEAEIVRWHVKAGDPVKVNQTIVEIETAKAVVELPCPFEGVVAALLAEEGETVDVGRPIIAVDDGSPAPALPPPADAPAGRAALADDMVPAVPASPAVPGEAGRNGTAAEGGEKRQPVLVGYGVKPGAAKRRPRKQPPAAPGPQSAASGPQSAAPAPSAAPVAQRAVPDRPAAGPAPQAAAPGAGPSGVPGPATAETGPRAAAGRVTVLAKPPVRKLAKDLGIDLAALTGTGPQGSITREDVHAAAAAPVRPAARAGAADEERIPVKGVRKATAQAMVASAFTAPHVTEFLQVDMTGTMEAVGRLRALDDFAGVRVSPLLLVAKALLVAVRRHPMVNSAWDEAAQEIVVKHRVNLGIAAATPRGLLVPNVKDAHSLSLPELAAALTELAETARAGRTQPADMAGGTITITNVGVFGVDAGTPILNPGESAILALGQVRDMPWVVDGQIAVRKVCTLALSFDHRVVDGELGSLFLRDIGAMLEDPLRMLAWG